MINTRNVIYELSSYYKALYLAEEEMRRTKRKQEEAGNYLLKSRESKSMSDGGYVSPYTGWTKTEACAKTSLFMWRTQQAATERVVYLLEREISNYLSYYATPGKDTPLLCVTDYLLPNNLESRGERYAQLRKLYPEKDWLPVTAIHEGVPYVSFASLLKRASGGAEGKRKNTKIYYYITRFADLPEEKRPPLKIFHIPSYTPEDTWFEHTTTKSCTFVVMIRCDKVLTKTFMNSLVRGNAATKRRG